MKRFHFFNMYLTCCISVALVLFLIGIESILLLAARDVVTSIKQKVSLTIVLNDELSDMGQSDVDQLDAFLTVSPFVNEHHLVTKEQALEEHIRSLGDDPTQFLGYNPLLSSYEVTLQPQYAQVDSIANIEQRLATFACIKDVVYQKDVIRMLDQNLSRFSVIVLGIAAILLFVAIALIVNTIRLHIYSKRFLINTMKLVGATPWIIKRPIIRRNMLMGILASAMALIGLSGGLYYCQQNLGIVFLQGDWRESAVVAAIVFGSGLMLTFFASLFATNRYIRMKTNDLYYI